MSDLYKVWIDEVHRWLYPDEATPEQEHMLRRMFGTINLTEVTTAINGAKTPQWMTDLKERSMGTKRPSWDDVWMTMADTIAARSLCCRAQVGAVIVDCENNVIATSYNGPPKGMAVTGSCSGWCPRGRGDAPPRDGYVDCFASHAEMNALARLDSSLAEGATIFVTTSMCFSCAKVIANTGITRVVARWDTEYRDPDRTRAFLMDCGLEAVEWTQTSSM